MNQPAPAAVDSAEAPAPADPWWQACLRAADQRRRGQAPALQPPHGAGAAPPWWDLLAPLLRGRASGRPWVIGQLGQSLDGFVATRTGDACYVNGPESLTHLHRLRALSDAVLVGAGTVVADDPRLTTRRVPGPNPLRVLLDPQLRLAAHWPRLQVFQDGLANRLWLCDARWQAEAEARAGAAAVLAVPGLCDADGAPVLARALAALAQRGVRCLFVEGGGVTVSRFLAQDCLDRLHLALAPVVIGDGRPGLRFAGAARLADCRRPRCRVVPMGADQLWDLDLRQPACG